MGVSKMVNSRGNERIIRSGPMRCWICKVCSGFCGYTWRPLDETRHAFCRFCDKETEQVSKRDKVK